MCILFIYTALNSEEESDYTFILASNRDEYYDRPARVAGPWEEDLNVIGGRDMEKGREGGTWLALAPSRSKLAVLLNLSGNPKQNAKGRGNIVADYVKSTISVDEYIKTLEPYAAEFNDFSMVTAQFGRDISKVQNYSNVTNKLQNFDENYLGFGNSLPDNPLQKVVAGKKKFEDVCKRYNKIDCKDRLVDDLMKLLKWDQRHLPDEELKRRCPYTYENLSSVYVNIPEGRYGTRTHTIILVTKSGNVEFYESTMESPIDPQNPKWKNTKHLSML